ncbi:hypothetical protein [Aureliella helgolandensis]|uniref:Uncharacterized protein n=1 Tax=Aureliella helgolandensis TaxID=2527968 RepID=A0A518G2E1_9BACT|nr:hypothetical protein [Aureliella helgolandensis]QDV22761.1 hypothetical protein Q31a_10520 [Aureliella helgolandensis]
MLIQKDRKQRQYLRFIRFYAMDSSSPPTPLHPAFHWRTAQSLNAVESAGNNA